MVFQMFWLLWAILLPTYPLLASKMLSCWRSCLQDGPKTARRQLQGGSEALSLRLFSPVFLIFPLLRAISGPSSPQLASKMPSCWLSCLQDGFKLFPRLQLELNFGSPLSRMASRWPRVARRWLQDSPKSPKEAPRRPQEEPGSSQDGPKTAPRQFQEGSSRFHAVSYPMHYFCVSSVMYVHMRMHMHVVFADAHRHIL